MNPAITVLTDTNFTEEVAGSELPVLVDFWAEWCSPCLRIAPILDELVQEHGDRLRVAKLNVDHAPETTMRFGVMSIPTLIVFKDGVEKTRIRGAKGKQALLDDLAQYLEAPVA